MSEPNGTVSARSSLAEWQPSYLNDAGPIPVADASYGQVLAQLIEKAALALDSEAASFMLYDEATGHLQLQRPTVGLSSDEHIHACRIPLDDGGSLAAAFTTGEPYVSNVAEDGPPSAPGFVELFNIRSLATVPLRVANRSIGLLHAINKKRGNFTAQDVVSLQHIAAAMTVTVQSAAAVRSLLLVKSDLERRLDIHNRLTELALQRYGITDLARRLAELIQTDLVVCHSGEQPHAALDRSLENNAEVTVLLDRLADRDASVHDPVRITLSTGQVAVGIPLIAAGEVLGGLVAVGSRSLIDTETILHTLQQSALVMALLVVKGREVRDVERRLRADVLDHLLVTTNPAEEARLLRRLGLEPGETFRIAQILHATGPTQLAGQSHDERISLHRLLAQLLDREWPRAVPLIAPNGVMIALPESGMSLAEQRRRLDRILMTSRATFRLRATIALIAVGSPATGSVSARSSLKDTEAVIVASRLLASQPVVFVEDLGLLRLLAHSVGTEDVRRFVHDTLGPLLESARDWTPFLEALVLSNFSVKHTAQRMGLHLNTARYRARRIQERLGIDFNDAEARLSVMVAVRLRQLMSATDDSQGVPR
jgi:purine catabolism regulator